MNDMLFHGLLEIVFEYSNNNKLVDSEFYERVWDVFKNDVLISKYLNELILINSSNENKPEYRKYVDGLAGMFGQAAYDFINCDLVVYEDNLKRNNSNIVNQLSLDDCDKIMFYNLLVVQTLLHEFEHVIQEVKKNTEVDYESGLFRLFDNLSETSASYEYSIYERLAEINSYNIILKMIETIGISSQNVYDYFSKKLNDVLKNGYHYEDDNGYIVGEDDGIFVSPTERYARLCGKDISSFVEQIDSIDEKIKYGFSISVDEYNKKFDDSYNFKM